MKHGRRVFEFRLRGFGLKASITLHKILEIRLYTVGSGSRV